MHLKFLKTFSVVIFGFAICSNASLSEGATPPLCQCHKADDLCKQACNPIDSPGEKYACTDGCTLGYTKCMKSIEMNAKCPSIDDCKKFNTSCEACSGYITNENLKKTCDKGCSSFLEFCIYYADKE